MADGWKFRRDMSYQELAQWLIHANKGILQNTAQILQGNWLCTNPHITQQVTLMKTLLLQ